jgi:cytochrome c oxidase subunit I+III
MITRRVGDVSSLPTSAFGHVTPQWWGVVGMTAIEGTIFALCVASYFYLRLQVPAWPPRPIPLPDLLPGTINTILILLGMWSTRVVETHALRLDRALVLKHSLIFAALTLAIMATRFYEFEAFHAKWDTNAYGSIIWITLFFHSLHLLTTFLENAVLIAYISSRGLDEKRALDLQLNRVYWDFIAGSWLVLYGVLYFGPRVLN